MMIRHTVLFATLSVTLVAAACDKKKDDAPAAAPAAKTEPAAPAAKTEPAAAAALVDIDLSKAGDAWKGFHVKGLAGADVTDNGAGGVFINFKDNTGLQLLPAENRDVKQFKEALAGNYKSVTYTVDTPDALEYTTVTELGGKPFTGYGFSIVVTAGGKKVECGSSYDDQATANRMKDVCKSLAKG